MTCLQCNGKEPSWHEVEEDPGEVDECRYCHCEFFVEYECHISESNESLFGCEFHDDLEEMLFVCTSCSFTCEGCGKDGCILGEEHQNQCQDCSIHTSPAENDKRRDTDELNEDDSFPEHDDWGDCNGIFLHAEEAFDNFDWDVLD